MEKKEKNKKFLTIVITLIVIGVLVFVAPILYFFGDIFVEMVFDKPSKPTITHGEFPFELIYEYNGKEITIRDIIICDYNGVSFALDGGNHRDWTCVIKNNNNYGRYIIDRDIENLYIQIPLEADYYMGAPNANSEIAKPYIYYIDDSTGTVYYEQDLSNVVGAKIVSWNPSEPIQNTFK